MPLDKQVPRQDGGEPHNYQTTHKEKTVSEYEHLLMAGIASPETCYQTFVTPNKLDWGVGLKCGDRVYVSIPDQHVETIATHKATAVIRYVGNVKFQNRHTFGVEIMVM